MCHICMESHDSILCWSFSVVHVFFFFFQAEDGIRDWSVTGVQTCALPIFDLEIAPPVRWVARDNAAEADGQLGLAFEIQVEPEPFILLSQRIILGLEQLELQIGRASCRERV